MDEPVFSVIVTAYNQPQEIKRAVESVLNQTVKCFELIVVDDNSTDKSLNILKEYSDKDKRIKIIKQENKGPACARNIGIQKA